MVSAMGIFRGLGVLSFFFVQGAMMDRERQVNAWLVQGCQNCSGCMLLYC